MKFVAFLTYNSIGLAGNVKSGVHHHGAPRSKDARKALVLQNTQGKTWATAGRKGHSGPASDHGAAEVRAEIEKLWTKLEKHASKVDHIVFYLGREGAELALEKVAAKFPANKVTIVSCSCGAGLKDMAIKAVGLKAAQRIQCRKCGGQLAMHELLIRFLEDGELRVEFS